MKRFKIATSFLLIFAMLIFLVPLFTMNTQAAEEQSLELHAFYPAQMTFSEKSQKYIDSLDSVSFAWGRLYGDLPEEIVTTLGKNGNTMFYYPKDYIEVLRYTKSKNKSIQLNIFSDSVNAEKILPYKEQREKAISAIVNILTQDVSQGEQIYFDGVVIDIEGLQNNEIEGKTIGAWYSQFLKELKAKLKKIDKKLYVAVNPLLYFTGYNYKTISEVADKMIVMAHDYEPVTKLSKADIQQYTGYNSVNPIDSLAPIKKIQLSMEDLRKNVSKANLKKVMLQISFDAGQWRFEVKNGLSWNKLDNQTMSMEARNTPTYEMIYNRVQNKDKKGTGITYGYNNELQSPYIQYLNVSDNTHNILIYENSSSIKAKMDMVKQYGLGGISLWSLSNVPDYTDTKSKNFGLNVWDTILKSLTISTATTNQAPIVFKDKVIETVVREQLMKSTGYIYKSDLNRVYRLAIPEGFKTLEDLKQLVNLEYLDLSNKKITDITTLASLKNLRVLYLQRNDISDISALIGLTKLEILSINGNKVTNISSLSKMTKLKELYIRENKINDFSPISNLKNLNTLYLKPNSSTDYLKLSEIKKNLIDSDF